MYKTYRRKLRRKKNILVGLITLTLTLIIVTIAIKIGNGNLLGSSAYTTLASSEILATQSQNMEPKMDINAIQTSLENVVKQYQAVLSNSTNKTNRDTLVSEIDKLYSSAASANSQVKFMGVSANNEQILDDLIQGSGYLAASLFEMKDSLICDGDFSATQLQNSKEDLTLAIKILESAKQELNN